VRAWFQTGLNSELVKDLIDYSFKMFLTLRLSKITRVRILKWSADYWVSLEIPAFLFPLCAMKQQMVSTLFMPEQTDFLADFIRDIVFME
jgi:hypothetical protein